MNKRMICALLVFCTALTLAACGNKDNSVGNTMHLHGSPEQTLFTDKENLSVFEKRTLLSDTFPSVIPLTDGEDFSLELPFTPKEVEYASDNANVVSVDEAGTVTPVGSGEVMVHITVDGIEHHIIFQVSSENALSENTVYQPFILDQLDEESAIKELEAYASSCCKMVIQDAVKEDTNNLLHEDVFAINEANDACSVKYKLLTTIDYLMDQKVTALAIEFLQEDNMVSCRFYGTR